MYGKISTSNNLLGSFHMADVAMRYSDFVPRLYNLAKSLQFTPGLIMPSRAFRSVVQETEIPGQTAFIYFRPEC